MRIVAVIGSMRNGNTEYMVDEVISSIEKIRNIEVIRIHLRDLKMEFCDGCLICDETGQCVKMDDMSKIVQTIELADGLILASPARWSLLSGEMKTFFDRLNPLAMTEKLKGKKAIIFAVGQSDEEEKASIITAADSIDNFCVNAEIDVLTKVIVCGCYAKDDIKEKEKYIIECKDAGKMLVSEIERS